MTFLLSTKRFGMGDDDTTSNAPDVEIDLGSGAGVLTASDFNSTKYPGVCKPTNAAAFQAVANFQRQMNRAAKALGLKMIGIDGDVGPGTLTLYNQLLGIYHEAGQVSNCLTVAVAAPQEALMFQQQADAAGVPATITQPAPSSTPSYAPPGGGPNITVKTPESGSIASAFTGLSTPMKLAAVGVFGGIAYLAAKEMKKSKRKGR
jgi:hypothetical protein